VWRYAWPGFGGHCSEVRNCVRDAIHVVGESIIAEGYVNNVNAVGTQVSNLTSDVVTVINQHRSLPHPDQINDGGLTIPACSAGSKEEGLYVESL
jgi:hypothetical protein